MKKITIGRGRECDIRLDDSTDMVSRRQAVITVSPTGKMEIYDTSSNGTFVNGEKVEKPNGKPIKRGDQINFAHVVDLDWDQVKDPYKSMKISLFIGLVAVVIIVVLFFAFADFFTGKQNNENETTEVVVDSVKNEDSLKLQIPEETPTLKAPAVRQNKSAAKPSRSYGDSVAAPPSEKGSGTKKDKSAVDGLKNNPKASEAFFEKEQSSSDKKLQEAMKDK